MKEVTLNDLLAARKMLEHAACNYPSDIFSLAKEEYLQKLNIYCDDKTGMEQYERFRETETLRTEQLSFFNATGSSDVDKGNHKEVRKRSASDRSA